VTTKEGERERGGERRRRANLIVEKGLEEGKDLAFQLRCIVPPPPNILHLVFRF
jgi:hypothetical protein